MPMPPVPDVPAWASGLSQQRGEALYPPIDGDVVDLDASFDQQFLYVAVREPEPEVPTNREQDDIGREAEASEG